MATMSAMTVRTAEFVRTEFAGRQFTAEELEVGMSGQSHCTLDTLRRHGVVRPVPRYEVTRSFSPAEFAEYVTRLVGEDLWGWDALFSWDADAGIFEERSPIAPAWEVC